ncbi:MAG: anti-sigma factor [Methylococcaceae bacterium]|nr:anti-sigma factor [Methylococcaceae bacterium]
MKNPFEITDSEIQAYVDNQLDPDRYHEIEVYIKTHPETAALIEDYQFLNSSIQALYDSVLDEKLPEQYARTRSYRKSKQRNFFKIAASLAWLMIGGIVGWSIHPAQLMLAQSIDGQEVDLVQPASFAHTVYSTETSHPVEVSAKEEKHLVGWLSKRLHTDIKAPDLTKYNFELIGGRLLPSTNRMAAQFMYQKQNGVRITLYIRRGEWNNNKTTFHYSNQGSISVLYWINGEMGYALVGQLDKTELYSLSEEVFRQINS